MYVVMLIVIAAGVLDYFPFVQGMLCFNDDKLFCVPKHGFPIYLFSQSELWLILRGYVGCLRMFFLMTS